MRPVPVAPGQTLHAVPPGPEPEYVTVSQVSLRLGYPEHLIRKAIRLNLIHTARAGRTGFFKAADLEAIRAALAELVPPAGGLPTTITT